MNIINTTRMKVVAEGGLDIYDSPYGNKKGHYDVGDIIRTIELDSKSAAKDGQIYVRYTQGGSLGLIKNWVVYENIKGNITLQPC